MTETKNKRKNIPIDSVVFESDSASLEVPDLSFPEPASILSYELHYVFKSTVHSHIVEPYDSQSPVILHPIYTP